MKILFIINKFGGGGRERRLIQLIKGLDAIRGFELHATVFHDDVEYPEVKDTSLKVHHLNIEGRMDQVRKYNTLVSEIKPDIIHNWIETPTECVLLPILTKKYGCKYIAGFVADGNRIKSLVQRMAVKYTFSKASAIVSNSRAGLVAKDAPYSKSVVIYNGFDNNRLSKVDRTEKRNQLGVKHKILVSMAARINDAKNWDMYVDLAKLSSTNNLDVEFLAIGNGEKLEYFQKLVAEDCLCNIHFIGRRTDVEEIIDASDICMLFTNNEKHAEGVSNFIMEAMAAGKPVVATDGGGTPEIIDKGIDGFIISPSNVEEAYYYLNLMIEHPDAISTIGAAARKKIESKFMLSKMTDEYIALYERILAQ